ncbi:MAG: flagellar export protein FliJ [Deltaproteobacteria bacterium]|nr:flagellar export protein FliJ [Deltaproteobacteria bacterium]
MKKFAFKLEALHEYRRRLEGMTLRELATVVERLEEEELKLALLREIYLKAAKDADRARAASDIKGLRLYADYVEGLKRHIENQGRVIDAFRREYGVKRDELSGVSRDRKVLDKAREQGLLRHIKESEAAEQKELDEISAAAYIRK